MTERAPEGAPPRTSYPPVEPTGAVARRNFVLGLGLVALFLLVFGATFVIAVVYLHYD
jgi:hypothetical protein